MEALAQCLVQDAGHWTCHRVRLRLSDEVNRGCEEGGEQQLAQAGDCLTVGTSGQVGKDLLSHVVEGLLLLEEGMPSEEGTRSPQRLAETTAAASSARLPNAKRALATALL